MKAIADWTLDRGDRRVGWHIQLADFAQTQLGLPTPLEGDEQVLEEPSENGGGGLRRAPSATVDWETQAAREQEDLMDATAIVVLGPIGYGKSVFAARLCESLNKRWAEKVREMKSGSASGVVLASDEEDTLKFVHIDGDALYFPGADNPHFYQPRGELQLRAGETNGHGATNGHSAPSALQRTVSSFERFLEKQAAHRGQQGAASSNSKSAPQAGSASSSSSRARPTAQQLTARLGPERGAYTIWCALEVLHHNKVPILSCGGGVLFDWKRRFQLRKSIEAAFGPDFGCRIVACLPPLGPGDEFSPAKNTTPKPATPTYEGKKSGGFYANQEKMNSKGNEDINHLAGAGSAYEDRASVGR